ncbi:Delta(24)-sterol reductase [Pseudocercospora fuligena]|uniref:Delta(24)-sterol reductase n=1 Tax=Pseudocercospora fuligena TaxID=685502 RepID=A0A8H6RMM3_9PEZI|nr:Delta(24)-sterol reductase [Pseudocercospora fuligena]
MEQHRERVNRIAEKVKHFHENKKSFRMYRGGATNSTRDQALRGKDVVDTSELNHVLKVDTEKRTILVETNVPMDRLVEASLEHDLVPPVVMEFPGITAGGGYSGTSGESSSFKHGFFDRTICRTEMVLATGEIVSCSETENPDLFRGAAGAMGTLGVIASVEVRLVPATKFVELTYHPVRSFKEAVDRTKEFTSLPEPDQPDYVDGIMYSKDFGTIMTGRRTDEQKSGINIARFSASSDPWFYLHAKEQLQKSKAAVTELIPLAEYLFRYDRGAFWIGHSVFDFCWWLPDNHTTRKMLDEFLHTRMLYVMGRSQPINLQIIHDIAVPMSGSAEFLDWATTTTEIWPLWLCPLKPSPQPALHPHAKNSPGELILNIGIWGAPKELSIDCYLQENKEIEEKLREVGGIKWGYSPNFCSVDDFWLDYDRKWYEELREKYGAVSLPTICDKARTEPDALTKKLNALTLKDYLPFWIPGPTLWAMWTSWKSHEWKWKRESTWMNWVPRE